MKTISGLLKLSKKLYLFHILSFKSLTVRVQGTDCTQYVQKASENNNLKNAFIESLNLTN